MCDRDAHPFDSQAIGKRARHTFQSKPRLSPSLAGDLNVSPTNAVTPPSAEGLHRRFLHGEPRGVALVPILVGFAVRNLPRGEDPLDKCPTVARDGSLDPVDFRNIETQSDDHITSPSHPALLVEL